MNKNKLARIRNIGLPVLLALAVSVGPNVASAQTGSRAKSNSLTTTTVWLREPGELKTVARLLQRGKTERAIKIAQDFVDEAKYKQFNSDIGNTRLYRSAGLNALCVALTAGEQFKQAIEACEEAIRIHPGSWQAINSLGGAYYAQGDFKRAADNYRRALEVAPARGRALAIVNHNIKLADAR